MEWRELKESIITDLTSRGLKNPMIRIRALEKIESIVRQYYPSYFENIDELLQIGKESFKHKISEKKGKELNSAEKSVINEIYYRLKPQPSKVRYKVDVCPHCFTTLKITEDLWEYDNLTCLQCGNTMPNPIKEEERLQKIGRGFQEAAMFNDASKLILWIGFLAFIIWGMWSC